MGAGLKRARAAALATQKPRAGTVQPAEHAKTPSASAALNTNDQPVSDHEMAETMPKWRLYQIAEQLVVEATAATNALACLARAQYQHAEVARLHTAIGLLKEQLVGYHGKHSVSEASGSAQSAAQKSTSQDVELARLTRARVT